MFINFTFFFMVEVAFFAFKAMKLPIRGKIHQSIIDWKTVRKQKVQFDGIYSINSGFIIVNIYNLIWVYTAGATLKFILL